MTADRLCGVEWKVPEDASTRLAKARLGSIVEHMVQDAMQQQRAAIERLLPVAARRGVGVVVLTAWDGRWRVQFDSRLAAWTVGHQPVESLADEPDEERSIHAD